MKYKGFVIFEGPSRIDGSPIVVIATMQSKNEKTGDMIQTWIMRSDMHPLDALKSGADYSICGNCKHRPFLDGPCYVNVGQAPSAIFKAYKRGLYPRVKPSAVPVHGRKVRIGAYGDGAAAPTSVWIELVDGSDGWTGYSHQWQESFFDPAIMAVCMASVDNPQEYSQAKAKGYRTFRVRVSSQAKAKREIDCPASDEAGNKTKCIKCTLCNGSAGNSKRDIVILAHGAKASRFAA
jgi:hypothetical protein